MLDRFPPLPQVKRPNSTRRFWKLRATGLLHLFCSALLLLLLASCDQLGGDDESPEETQTPAPTPLSAQANEIATPGSEDNNVGLNQEDVNLIVWTIPEISPRSEVAGGSLLAEQFNAYDIGNAQVDLEVLFKAASGQGGILSYLRTGRGVADEILPDVVLLPTDQLAAAAEQQLIFPLDDLLPDNALADVYPAARNLATIDGRLMGYPFALNSLSHIVYNSNTITGTIPSAWTGLVETDGRFVFPASSEFGGILTLQFYLANGGALTNEAGQTSLQLEALEEGLSQINDGRNTGLIIFQSGSTSSLEEAWELYQNGIANISLTTADDFLARRRAGDNSAFQAIPGPNGSLDPLVKGWVWAISTADPTRQAQAVELISWLTNEQNLGPWSQQSSILPATRPAFASWDDDSYINFLSEQLERAEAFPVQADSDILMALETAVFELLSLSEAANIAAQKAVDAVRP